MSFPTFFDALAANVCFWRKGVEKRAFESEKNVFEAAKPKPATDPQTLMLEAQARIMDAEMPERRKAHLALQEFHREKSLGVVHDFADEIRQDGSGMWSYRGRNYDSLAEVSDVRKKRIDARAEIECELYTSTSWQMASLGAYEGLIRWEAERRLRERGL